MSLGLLDGKKGLHFTNGTAAATTTTRRMKVVFLIFMHNKTEMAGQMVITMTAV